MEVLSPRLLALALLIKYGFLLDYKRSNTIQTDKTNNTSALQYPSHVDAYLTDEMKYRAMLGPFKEPPINDLHISPL